MQVEVGSNNNMILIWLRDKKILSNSNCIGMRYAHMPAVILLAAITQSEDRWQIYFGSQGQNWAEPVTGVRAIIVQSVDIQETQTGLRDQTPATEHSKIFEQVEINSAINYNALSIVS